MSFYFPGSDRRHSGKDYNVFIWFVETLPEVAIISNSIHKKMDSPYHLNTVITFTEKNYDNSFTVVAIVSHRILSKDKILTIIKNLPNYAGRYSRGKKDR